MDQTFSFVLNVIAAGAEALASPLRAVAATHGAAGDIAWLSQGYAFDLPFTGDAALILRDARAAAPGMAADINVVPDTNRRKKLLIADMDSTIINCEVLDEIADFAGLKLQVATITERAMRGEIEFDASLRQRLALLKGLPIHRLARVYGERVRLNPGARALVATMRAQGAHTMLVSSGFTYFTSRVADDLGFDENRGNILLDDGTRLTGLPSEPILAREAKIAALEETASRFQIDLSETLAVGDGANDLGMIRMAGLGVAWHAKPIIAEAAAARIDHADLRSLLYLQGYHDEEIVSG